MSYNKIALIGATGNLGAPILSALLDAGFEVTILTREGSTSTDSLASHPRQKIVKTNFDDVNSIKSALAGIDAVVSNIGSHVLLSQKKIIDAAIAAGVKRFIPSEFGSDSTVDANAALPLIQPKVEIRHYLEDKVEAHPEFTYTALVTGPFFDWCLRGGLFGDLKTHTMTVWDGGESKLSVSTLASVGKAVVGVLRNPEATRNKIVYTSNATISQKLILDVVKEADGKEWTTTTGNTDDALQLAFEEFKKPNPNVHVIVLNQLYTMFFNPDKGGDFEHKLDNEKIGVERLTEEQVKDVIRSALA